MFRPFEGHHQAFFETSRQFAANMVAVPTIFMKLGAREII